MSSIQHFVWFLLFMCASVFCVSANAWIPSAVSIVNPCELLWALNYMRRGSIKVSGGLNHPNTPNSQPW